MNDKLDSLIELLRNDSTEFGERLDVAHEMENYDDDRAENAVCEICTNNAEDEDVVENCAESLGGIWSRKGRINEAVYKNLTPRAKLFVDAIIRDRNPELAKSLKA